MSEDNKNMSSKDNKQSGGTRNPFTGRNFNNKVKKPKGSVVMYVIYTVIILILGIVWFGSDSKTISKPITWSRLAPILIQQDEEKVVVVNKEYAKIYIKEEALKSDSAYSELRNKPAFGKGDADPGFYVYEFVTLESFEKDLDEVENQIVARDTAGMADSTGAIDHDRLFKIQRDAQIELISEKKNNAWKDVLVIFGPFVLLIVFFVAMSRMSSRQMGGGSSIFSVGKSRAKLYDGETPTNITFKDVAGLAGAKEEVMEIVDFLKSPKRYTDLGGKIPKGVLLVGPPGTGKTLLAKAVAGEANVPFFSMSGSDFVEMFVGVGASRVRDVFEEAKKKSPCIIFIDEIDAVGRARGKSGLSNANDERENTLNQLLTEMDGFTTNTGVIVLAATNRADVLDKALLRAGRFDRQIYVELPDLEERKAIFEVHMKGLKLSGDIDKEFLAKQTPGFSGADIANVCNEAALVAARKGKKNIEKQDFLDAIDRIVGGLEKRTKVLTDQEKHTIAYHESGHASVSWLLRWGDPLVKVTIVPRGKALGAAWYLPEERQITTYEQMFDSITSLMAGRASEECVFGKISTGALNDMERATKMAYSMVVYYGMSTKIGNLSYYDSMGQNEWNFTKPYSEHTAEEIDKEVKRIVEDAYAVAKRLIIENRSKLDQLARILYEREVIFKDDVEQIYGPRPWVAEIKVASKFADKQAESNKLESGSADAETAQSNCTEENAVENLSENAETGGSDKTVPDSGPTDK